MGMNQDFLWQKQGLHCFKKRPHFRLILARNDDLNGMLVQGHKAAGHFRQGHWKTSQSFLVGRCYFHCQICVSSVFSVGRQSYKIKDGHRIGRGLRPILLLFQPQHNGLIPGGGGEIAMSWKIYMNIRLNVYPLSSLSDYRVCL